jgi:hypothetical protein
LYFVFGFFSEQAYILYVLNKGYIEMTNTNENNGWINLEDELPAEDVVVYGGFFNERGGFESYECILTYPPSGDRWCMYFVNGSDKGCEDDDRVLTHWHAKLLPPLNNV